jgi:filamentous hemagglutinin family protein
MKKSTLPCLAIPLLSIFPQIVLAQTYTPSNRTPQADNSIGTQVAPTGNNNFNITGGLQRGQNLFHSFSDFSIPTGGAANFTNPTGNQSIITRVTGNLFSDLNGNLNTNGANFLLINPNGVVFGTGVSLNVGKAFVASTASGINFIDAQGQNYNFGVNRAGDVPLIAIDPNIAFSPAKLIVNASLPGSKGIEHNGFIFTNNPAQYIGLIGGDINFNGGKIFAGGAKVELAGLRQQGEIGFSLDNGIKLPVNVERGNVSMVPNQATDSSLIYLVAGGGGNVNIFSKNIKLQGKNTGISVGIGDKVGSPTAKAGDIKIDATGNFNLADGAVIFNLVNPGGVGKGGNIDVVTNNLSVTNTSRIATDTVGKGDAGNIKITAAGDILLDGRTGNFISGLLSAVEGGAEGNAGDIEIETRNLVVSNGAAIVASTQGIGNAGKIKITASEMSFDGGVDNGRSGVFSTVESSGTGTAGGIEIFTGNLAITNGAGFTASTLGKGNAGNIKITASKDIYFDGAVPFGDGKNAYVSGLVSAVEQGAEGKGGGIEIFTRNLLVTNGGGLTVGTYGKGDAGKIKITASANVSFSGGVTQFRSAALSGVAPGVTGNGGAIEIAGANIIITNGALLNASTEGTGSAGDIILTSNSIDLNRSAIISRSTSSTGGNINIDVNDYFLLQNNSNVATSSDSIGKNGNGGNININSPLIITLPGNNDITANAYQGKGGQVKITTQGLFGIQYRPQDSPLTNDITASSTFGQSGNVNITTPSTDPGKDKGELPVVTSDASKQISQACGASQRDNKFYITGRGGLPPNASEPLESEELWQDARAQQAKPATTAQQPAQLAPPAIGWVFEKDGTVRLIAAQTAGGVTGGTGFVCPNK